MKNRNTFGYLFAVGTFLTLFATQARADHMQADVKLAIKRIEKRDPTIKKFFESSLAYVVLPNVGKGGFIVGGAHGDGLVYEHGKIVGDASMTQATIGLQAGGEEFSEFLFFEDANALSDFKSSKFNMAANVSAVIAKDGAAGEAKYSEGVAVFLLPKGGLMLEASVGGQKFSYTPAGKK